MAFNIKKVFSFGVSSAAPGGAPEPEIDEVAEAAARAQAWARLAREQVDVAAASSTVVPEPDHRAATLPSARFQPQKFPGHTAQNAPEVSTSAAHSEEVPSAPMDLTLPPVGHGFGGSSNGSQSNDADLAPMPPELAAAPPKTLAPSTVRQQFGERIEVGAAVGRAADGSQSIPPVQTRGTWLGRMRAGLSRSSRELSQNLSGVFTKGRLTEEFTDELEEVLIRADFGADTAMRITESLTEGRYGLRTTEREIRDVLAGEIAKVLQPVARPLELDLSRTPHVILVVGVNGTGKTTTIGKLAAKLTAGGLSVMLAAGDTFRAAAIEQLKVWGERTGSPVVSSKLGADAAGLAFEAFEKAKASRADVLIIDTAGRLQNKAELMAELEKIVRVLRKLDPDAPHTVLQTLDATTGQNALNQVDIFRAQAGVSGLVMTKLDGTARGGILVAIAAKHRLPVYFIGVGEGVDDLEPFSASDFAQTIAGTTYG